MRIDETTQFISLVSEATRREFSDTEIDIWHQALHRYSLSDCTNALYAAMAKSSAYLTPAEIVQRVKTVRDARLAAAGAPTTPPELQDKEDWEDYTVVYTKWLSAWTDAVLDGAPPQHAQQHALEAVGRPLAIEASVPFRNPLHLKGPNT